MKYFLFAIFAVFVLAGGGTQGFVQQAYAGGGSKDKGDSSSEFVKLTPLVLPIIDNNGVSQVVSMIVVLDVAPAAAEEVKTLSPRLKDAYLQDMYGMLNEHAALKGGVIQVGYIKERLSKISHKVMGEDKVNAVLLQAVQQRPI